MGSQLPPSAAARIHDGAAGVTLFRAHNVVDPPQIRRLTAAIQAARPAGAPPVLIAADQEGGQLVGLGDGTTPFAGAMALGATGDEELAERVARATGRELRALGVNVDYAPVCDVAGNPANPALGIRGFGDDPQAVGRFAAATVRGLQAEGVAATAKHFPGAGDAVADPHHELPAIRRTPAELDGRELVPFRAALAAGARLVMTGHLALPGGGDDLPSSLSAAVLRDLLRRQLRFEGVTVTDALDMRALAQGAAQIVDAVAALRAGEDVLLGTTDEAALERLEEGLAQAHRRGLFEAADDAAAAARVTELRRWLGRHGQPPLDVVGCADHQALAAELARRSITLVRNDDRLLPLKPPADGRIAVVQTAATDLTPADTSSTVPATLAPALRRRLPGVDEILLPAGPAAADLASLGDRLRAVDLVVVGTFSAHLQPAQAALAAAVLAAGRPTVTIALRTPWDLLAYPSSRTHVCSYGILPPSTEALAAALLGEAPFSGRLPVAIAGLHPRGHGLTV
ncbi:MAG TPA: glycoside hydrolase family 3 N-terminal domain-containing protein [Candidatus Sulfotelmatobacter sp.]|nr:glycoside hydrolase family 3 N-terminal domain-containing protein [Candidatus Sulfotelmatobacter sp.]